MNQNLTIIFLHMFKAYGTTLTARIRNSYSNEEHAIYNTSVNHPRHPFQMTNARLITGHFLFGIHTRLQDRFTYISLLRDPIERLSSAYYNIREEKCSGHVLHQICKDLTFRDFVKSDLPSVIIHTDNYQTRELIGRATNPDNRFFIQKNDYNLAIANIEQYFSYINTTNHIETAWTELQKKFAWKDYNIEHEKKINITNNKPKYIEEDIKTIIREKNKFDYQLINWININKEKINKKLL